MAAAGGRRRRYYVEGSKMAELGIEEDHTHEFKGHMSLYQQDIPPSAVDPERPHRASRQPISRAINAFVNSRAGGTVYLGVIDSGEIKGLSLIQYKMDHIKVAVKHLLTTDYKPPVPLKRFRVEFVPVVRADASQEEIEMILNFKPEQFCVIEQRKEPHEFRSPKYCWCDKERRAILDNGQLVGDYVVEIIIEPWNPNNPHFQSVGVGKMKAIPVHEDENGEAFFRRQASVRQYKNEEIEQKVTDIVADHYKPEIERLEQTLRELRMQSAYQRPGEDTVLYRR